ncbi:hypothetical protein AX17_004196 [Amanita inopinata Kibby_2008]|nr:hypothetical protein AX17_004196 [Amanita inopinata Kibby_2008]
MAMDRKNKKAAQAAAAAAAATERGITPIRDGSKDAIGKSGIGRKREGHQHNASVTGHGSTHGGIGISQGGPGRNTTLFTGGSTAPTRILRSSSPSLSTSRAPISMPLKATISPSAPAPPLKDTDFSSFAALDEMEGVDLPTSLDQSKMGVEGDKGPGEEQHGTLSDVNIAIAETSIGKGTIATDATRLPASTPDERQETKGRSKPASPVPLPTSAPRPSAPPTTNDYGPIGSPPSALRLNGGVASRIGTGTLSPGTSPRSNSSGPQQQVVNHGANDSICCANTVGLMITMTDLSPSSGRNVGAQPFLPSSPFSAPVAQSVFLSSSLSTRGDTGTGQGFMGGTAGRTHGNMGGGFNVGGVAASLGTGLALMGGVDESYADFGGVSKGNRFMRGMGLSSTTEQAVGDEDLEEFIPSSLSDLLTPEERRRRMSRSGQQQPQQQQVTGAAAAPTSRMPISGESSTSGPLLGHRYSRSVPAPSLLGELRSIWSDTSNSNATSQRRETPLTSERMDNAVMQSPGVANNKHIANGGGNLLTDDMGLSMSMGSSSSFGAHVNAGLSPSNASAAFLPGLHHHYLKAKQQGQLGFSSTGSGSITTVGTRSGAGMGNGTGLARGIRTASGPLFSGVGTNNSNLTAGNIGVHTHGGTTHTYRTTPSPFDLTQPQHQHHNSAGGIGVGAGTGKGLPQGGSGPGAGMDDPGLGPQYLSSPSARALQAHAPGQSLPQGLAAGLSRIHALPPLPSLASPGTSITSDASGGIPLSGPYGEWRGPASPTPNAFSGAYGSSITAGPAGTASVLDSTLPRMSYSAVTRGGAVNGPGHNTSPPGLSRGGRYQQMAGGAGAFSPLGPAPIDDDELFDMDG